MSSTQIETVTTGADKAKLAAAGLLVVGGVAAFYLLGQQSLWLRVVALLVLIAAGVAVFFTSAQGKELFAYGRTPLKELRKVVWPTRPEATQMTLYVFAFVVGHGPVPVADRQDPGVGALQPDSGLEAVIPGIHNTRLNP